MNPHAEREARLAGRKNDGTHIGTYTGRPVWPLQPQVYDFDIIDIAHALSLNCRWTGHVYRHYSVAEHSVRVGELLRANGHPELEFEGLMHDATEAYIADIARPVKIQLPEYRNVETNLAVQLRRCFGITPWDKESPIVKEADIALAHAESRDLMAPGRMTFSVHHPSNTFYYQPRIRPWGALRAEYRFIRYYAKLTGDQSVMRRWYAKKLSAFKYFTLGIGREPITPHSRVRQAIRALRDWQEDRRDQIDRSM